MICEPSAIPNGDSRITRGAVSVVPVEREISDMWIAKSFFVGLDERGDLRMVVERYTFPSVSQKSWSVSEKTM